MKHFFRVVIAASLMMGCTAMPPPHSTDGPTTDASITEKTDTTPRTENHSRTDTDERTTHPPQKTISPETPRNELAEIIRLYEHSQSLQETGDVNGALLALDQAFAALLRLDESDNAPPEEEMNRLRADIAHRVLEIHAARYASKTGEHGAEFPLEMNEHVQREIDFLSGSRVFRVGFQRSAMYQPGIAAIFKEEGLPEELSWLPIIESSYNPRALSPAGALGMWQFIQGTGRRFGLRRDDYVDERMCPEKATRAAVAYLKNLYGMFKDWPTVLAAYNCGEGRVLSLINQLEGNYHDNFWGLYERLPKETARYVPQFMAALHIAADPEKYGLSRPSMENPPVAWETVPLSRRVSLQDIAKAIEVSPATLHDLNPELRHRLLPPRAYSLRVPAGKTGALLARIDDIPESAVPVPTDTSIVYHRVMPGDSLSRIAQRYKTSVRDIMQLNRLQKRHFLVAGDMIKVSSKVAVKKGSEGKASTNKTSVQVADARSGKKGTPATVVASTSRAPYRTHVVRKGDSLWNIAKKYGTDDAAVAELNRLSGRRIRVGQELRIPNPGMTVKSISSKTEKSGVVKKRRVYTVKRGDAPMDIAQRHHMELDDFLRVNHLRPGTTIFPGQEVYVE